MTENVDQLLAEHQVLRKDKLDGYHCASFSTANTFKTAGQQLKGIQAVVLHGAQATTMPWLTLAV